MRPRTSLQIGFLAVLVLLVVGFAELSPVPTAQAAVIGCRSDPVVVLSDGTVLDLSVAINTAASNVTAIRYTVHGPQSAWLVATLSTPTIGFAGKETFTYVPDAGPRQYITETLVQTAPAHVAVTSYSTFSNTTIGYTTSLTLQYTPVSGFNAQVLRAVLMR